ncbi:sensor histidine kinase [Aeromicrobium sp.]|uniref:sensor histidine kinase n=1 Tax=Aeromicrobium sp. TaxID=1871063 RepID=UPI003C31B12D
MSDELPGAVRPSASWVGRHAGVRARLTIVTAVVVTAAVALAGLALVLLLGRTLDRSATSAAEQRAAELAAVLKSQGPAGANRVLATSVGETTIVQILDAADQVVVSSPQIAGEGPLTPRQGSAGSSTTVVVANLPVGDGAKYVVVNRDVTSSTGSYRLVVAQSLASSGASVAAVQQILLVGLPLLAAVVGGVTFVFVGRSLRPVELMRRRVADISATDLSTRLPVPPAIDEVHRLATTMNAMLDRLEHSQEAQRRFVADASHELRSPLSTVMANLQITGANPDPEGWPESHAAMVAETSRLDDIITDLLTLAESDHGLSVSEREDVDVGEVVAEQIRRLRSTSKLDIKAEVSPVVVSASLHHVRQIVRNLADNAAAHARSTVELSVVEDGQWAFIEVADDGVGLAPEDRERVFDRFVRLDAGRARDAGGTGLGLAIVKELAESYGGSVSVDQAHMGGARFRVQLPMGVNRPTAGSQRP